ncbi:MULTISPECIES: hypothetical protein [Cyanophyceae]|uniref:hypothetical protein n=1 Tax=Cyanophyceae TaxID=3028117 RepID=UPI00168874FA|nr:MULTISPECIES: hypothetical protein [Cyanophyceae]MBD1918881.1 hypothetical protein [Phormidium sp. FACHB-77]MBD2033277.1 hypothetical protein [Phormidium sp. FACHB-322]MBD2053790.1 hypothetical protein [Leptolyngbya sp. FACHB-60]
MTTQAKTVQAKIIQLNWSLTQEQKDAFDSLWAAFQDSDLSCVQFVDALQTLGN